MNKPTNIFEKLLPSVINLLLILLVSSIIIYIFNITEWGSRVLENPFKQYLPIYST